MPRTFDYANYDPKSFLQEHSQDENIQRALEAARQLATVTFPQQPNESALDAQRRIEQSFDKLKDQVAADLKIARQTELQNEKRDFIQEQRREITAKHFPGIANAPHQHLKEGGQAAYATELSKMEASVADHPTLKENVQQAVNFYAVLDETLPDGIDAVRDECLKKHGLDQAQTIEKPAEQKNNLEIIQTAPVGSEEFKEAIQQQKLEIQARRQQNLTKTQLNEMLLPPDSKIGR